LLPLPSTLDDLASRVAAWAVAHYRIEAIYVFGSQFRGDARTGSDLDLAIALNSPAEALLGDFILAAKEWRVELSTLLGYPVDVQLAAQEESPKVWKYLGRGCALIYRRRCVIIR
jgi:predicted nucleotidyltransferase